MLEVEAIAHSAHGGDAESAALVPGQLAFEIRDEVVDGPPVDDDRAPTSIASQTFSCSR